MSDRSQLREHLNELCKFLDNIYNINYGGCCIVASLIAKHLEKLQIPYSLRINDSEDKDLSAITSEVINRKINKHRNCSVTGNYTCNHYFLQIEDGGVNDLEEYDEYYEIHNVNYKQIKWIYRNGVWNDTYDTSDTKIVKGIINEFFKKYEIV